MKQTYVKSYHLPSSQKKSIKFSPDPLIVLQKLGTLAELSKPHLDLHFKAWEKKFWFKNMASNFLNFEIILLPGVVPEGRIESFWKAFLHLSNSEFAWSIWVCVTKMVDYSLHRKKIWACSNVDKFSLGQRFFKKPPNPVVWRHRIHSHKCRAWIPVSYIIYFKTHTTTNIKKPTYDGAANRLFPFQLNCSSLKTSNLET